jgi:23S rRNA pseudouridine2605 synthase
MSEQPLQRLQKVLAHAGVASRRRSEDLIRQGRVSVNGQIVTQLGTKVDPARDEIRVDGHRIEVQSSHVYIMLNKPPGVLSTMKDARGRPSLGDLVPVPGRLYPVGRLDAPSVGLILLTNDGELANLLTHPRYGHEKEYHVLVDGRPSDETLEAWGQGVILDGKPTAPARIDRLDAAKDAALLRIVMREGRKRQIRRIASLLGHPTQELRRVRLGPLHLGSLAEGQWRYLKASEIQALDALKRSARGVEKQRRSQRSRRSPRRTWSPGDRDR